MAARRGEGKGVRSVERLGSVEKRHCRIGVRRGEADHAGFRRGPRVGAGSAEMRGANRADSADAAFACDLHRQCDGLIADPMAETIVAIEEIVGDMGLALQANDAVRYRTLDGDFHLAMFVLSDNPFMLEAYKLIAFRVQALRNRLSLDSALNEQSFKDHVELSAMAVRGMKKRMVGLMLSHIASTRTHYLKEMEAADPAAAPVRPRQRFNAA
jgi:hypothetical protein